MPFTKVREVRHEDRDPEGSRVHARSLTESELGQLERFGDGVGAEDRLMSLPSGQGQPRAVDANGFHTRHEEFLCPYAPRQVPSSVTGPGHGNRSVLVAPRSDAHATRALSMSIRRSPAAGRRWCRIGGQAESASRGPCRQAVAPGHRSPDVSFGLGQIRGSHLGVP